MRFYSDELDKVFDTEDELVKAENAHKEAHDKFAARLAELRELYNKYVKAQKEADEAYNLWKTEYFHIFFHD